MGWLENHRLDRKDEQRSGVGESSSDLRRPIYQEPNHEARLKEFGKLEMREKVDFIEKGGWARMPGGEKADVFACRACVDGLDLLAKK